MMWHVHPDTALRMTRSGAARKATPDLDLTAGAYSNLDAAWRILETPPVASSRSANINTVCLPSVSAVMGWDKSELGARHILTRGN